MHFLVKKVEKDGNFAFLSASKSMVIFSGTKKSFIYFLDPILGHPVYQFLPKLEFSDFTVSGSGVPMGQRFFKYVSLCWSNSYIMATAPGGRVSVTNVFLPIASIIGLSLGKP